MSEDKDLQSEMSYFQRAMELFQGVSGDLGQEGVITLSATEANKTFSIFSHGFDLLGGLGESNSISDRIPSPK